MATVARKLPENGEEKREPHHPTRVENYNMVTEDQQGSDKPDIQTVCVMFTGEDRISSSGIPINVLGWWEIRGLTFAAGMEVAYALTNVQQMHVGTLRDVPRHKLTAGCTYVVQAGESTAGTPVPYTPGDLRWKFDGGRGAIVDDNGQILGYYTPTSNAQIRRVQELIDSPAAPLLTGKIGDMDISEEIVFVRDVRTAISGRETSATHTE